MNTFLALSKKEITQMTKEYKIVWLPIVYILLGLTQPIMMYFLPAILQSMGGIEGIMIDPSMAKPEGREVLASTLNSQFDQLGIIILAIATMGIIQGEKANGMMAFILTRPVSVSSYINSKILIHFGLAVICITLGYAMSFGYTSYLFTAVPITQAFLALVFYCVWLLFVITFVAMMSTYFNNSAFIALISIVVLFVCRFCAGLHPLIDVINPASNSLYATSILLTGEVEFLYCFNIIVTGLLVLLMVAIMHNFIAKKKF
ncbi:ABC transporter permease [Lysinibacillus cavernae]|uniref:ABC transporter permease n=1 Tax=Lysinibacillus cavernae TaxID=2666135 RepID=UPI0012D8DA1D|nr:ABC transporter permease [Lysinibacillus cavernae]